VSRPSAFVLCLSLVLTVGACSSKDQPGQLKWVAGLRPGDCVDAGNRPGANVVRMRVLPCRLAHSMEVYARLPYPPVTTASATATPSGSPAPSETPSAHRLIPVPTTAAPAAESSDTEYPGRDVLRMFAREACAEHFRAYLGSNPREPWYFLTYLFPSVASWTAASGKRPHLGPLARLVTTSVHSDRSVVCFVRTTGPALTTSVRGRVTPTAPVSSSATPTGGGPSVTPRAS
jgi:hypothetical protein